MIFRAVHLDGDNRRVTCATYDQCLDLAIKLEWNGGFSCERCQAFTPAQWALALGLKR